MILHTVLLKAYAAMVLSTVADEVWNMHNPRPYPNKPYNMMQWEEDDFIKLNDGSYLLRATQKADSNLKKYMRNKLGLRSQTHFKYYPKS